MKKTFLLLMLLVCVLALNACVGLQQNTSAGSTTTGYESLQVPDFANDAYLWYATAEAGKTQLSSNFRIIIKEGSSASSIASQVLSLTTGMNFVTTNDKIDNNPERANEILLGYITNRDASGAIFEEYQEQFEAYTQGVGSFFIGANGSKIMILAADEASISAAVKFFVTNYVNDKEVVEIESDLRSIYFFDKIEYSKSNTVVCLSEGSLRNNSLLLNLKINGQYAEGYSSAVNSYTYDIERSDAIPEISAELYSPYAEATIVQPTVENGMVGSVTVVSADGKTTQTCTVAFNRMSYNNINATLHKLKNGATGAITLVQDDGYKEATEIMLDVCRQYGLKFNIALQGKTFGSLKTENGHYVFDEDGNYETVITADPWWQNIIGQNADAIEITSHSLTHASWGLTDEKVRAEIVGSQQILREAFPGQKVLTFAYPGFTSDTREDEYAKAREYMPGTYLAARYLSLGRANGLTTSNIYELAACSLYYNDPATWGTGASNNDGWMMNAINSSCKSGGWVVTMNHAIQSTNSGLGEGSMTIDRAMFEHVVKNYIVPNVQAGLLWNGFFSEVAQYIAEYNASTMTCKSYEDGVILIDLTDTLDDTLYDYALTIDVPVDETWTTATFTYTGRDGSAVTQQLAISTATDGSHYVRVQLVPDCGTATLTRGN